MHHPHRSSRSLAAALAVACALVLTATAVSAADDNSAAELAPVADSFSKGNLGAAKEKIVELTSAPGSSNDLIERGSFMLAIAYFLGDSPDAPALCAGLREQLPATAGGKSWSAEVLSYLEGAKNAEKLTADMADAPAEWKSAAFLARYVKGLRDGLDPRPLYDLIKSYRDSIGGTRKDSWQAAWYTRVAVWQNWIQNDKGQKDTLEPLIAKNSATARKQNEDNIKTETRAAVADAIGMLLEGRVAEAEAAAAPKREFCKTKYGVDSPEAVVLSYLAGDKNLNEEKIIAATSTSPEMRAAGCLGLFAKQLLSTAKPDRYELDKHLRNYVGNLETARENTPIGKWKARVPAWQAWCASGFVKTEGLEPLLLKRSVAKAEQPQANEKGGDQADEKKNAEASKEAALKKVLALTPEKLEESRKPLAARPELTTAEFPDADFAKYFKTLPDDLRKKETLRYELIKEFKTYVPRVLTRSTFEGKITLRGGESFDGIVSLANEKDIIVKKSKKDRKGRSIKWKELDVDQYRNFILSFAQRRLKVKGAAEDGDPKADAAEDYLRLAVLCDFCKDYKTAVEYLRESVTIAPAAAPRAADLFVE